ncbi:MarR family transcriptional regulator [Streptomyces pakalii]|uniref:MarR family transcriptional regulator n=1 Tax=Streptomyces pakalii TaxID=3036494 RepID=A0ABT7DCC0_9ACTN|nr:MarR family transcriptional regulator [Streptomyces pakalii]MDJ1643447.1 MarR family transcriptional regulator [Streptomyces pakalii]
MATQHLSSALPAPAVSAAYPMAKPGYGKRSVPGQQPRTRDDFALLPTRERYVAGFVDHLPDGAAMSVKQLAKQLPLYGQQAISTALKALSVAGHLRRVRCAVGAGDQTRWVFRTFWSRTARDNEWWTTYLATEKASQAAAPTPDTAPPPPWVPAEEPPPTAQPENPPPTDQTPAPTAVPRERTPPQAPDTEPAPPTREATSAGHTGPTGDTPLSPAYLALARLGRDDDRLGLSADDCTTLEPLAAQWLDRGVTTDYLTNTLKAGLPAQVDSPVGLLRRRLIDKLPPHLPAPTISPDAPAPARRILVECTDCGRPGPPEALPDGLCHPCHTTHSTGGRPSPDVTQIAAVKAHMANLRDLLKPV